MKLQWSLLTAAIAGLMMVAGGCAEKPIPYGREISLRLPPGARAQVWAVAPALNLSGQHEVDPLLQADALYQQLQQIRGLTVIPVNRVAQVYAGLRIESVQSEAQAALVCDLLGSDALVVPTITAFDPYNPPKLGASLQLFRKPRQYARAEDVDPRELARAAAPRPGDGLPDNAQPGDSMASAPFVQAVGIFDASNGSVRDAVIRYAAGRHDPVGPMGWEEYLQNMERYSGFVYHALATDLVRSMEKGAEG